MAKHNKLKDKTIISSHWLIPFRLLGNIFKKRLHGFILFTKKKSVNRTRNNAMLW